MKTTPKGALNLIYGKTYYTYAHKSGVPGKHAVPHAVYKDARGWYFARIIHPERKDERREEFRKISYRDAWETI